MRQSRSAIGSFRGLVNVADPLRLDATAFVRADNCLVTNHGQLIRAPGYIARQAATSATGAYATEDQQRLYLVDDGELVQILPDFTRRLLASALSPAPMHFTEANGIVYYSNGVDRGILEPAGWRPWGIAPPGPVESLTRSVGELPAGKYQVCCTLAEDRGQESSNGEVSEINLPADSSIVIAGIPQVDGFTTLVYVTAANDAVFKLLTGGKESAAYNVAPEQLGIEIGSMWCNQPHGILPAFFAARMYMADPYPTLDQSVVWRSLPLHYHLFADGSEGVSVPGTVLMMQACDTALIIGTERAIYALDEDGKLDMLAPYGVLPGKHACKYEGAVYCWTQRGLCRMLPFSNLTEDTVSVAPGSSAAGTVIEQGGYVRYAVALHQAGVPYNANAPLAGDSDIDDGGPLDADDGPLYWD